MSRDSQDMLFKTRNIYTKLPKEAAMKSLNFATFTFYKERFSKYEFFLSVIPKHCHLPHTPVSKVISRWPASLKSTKLILMQKKSYNCNQCGFSCNIPSRLKTHMRVHSGEKPFVCSKCNHSCNQAGRLRIHVLIQRKTL